ncbi:MAG: hypothetical protein Q8929_17215 [Bacillota bacterium]|nr:hypothetical protein [Bacillota bacterium]
MDAAVWRMISIIGYFLAGVFLVASIILFFKMNIRTIIGDLTGKTAARQIQEIRERNLMTGNKPYKPAAFQLERGTWGTGGNRTGRKIGKTAQAIAHASKRLDLKAKTDETSQPIIERIEGFHTVSLREPTAETSAPFSTTEVLSETTELLVEQTEVFLDRTELLEAENATEVLGDTVNGTDVLSQTTVLYPTEELAEYERVIPKVDFKIVKDIKIIHTNEMI